MKINYFVAVMVSFIYHLWFVFFLFVLQKNASWVSVIMNPKNSYKVGAGQIQEFHSQVNKPFTLTSPPPLHLTEILTGRKKNIHFCITNVCLSLVMHAGMYQAFAYNQFLL